MAILKHIASKSSNFGAALEYLIFKHDEYRKTPILDKNGNRIMRDEFYLDGLNCEPYSFDAACQQLNREYQKNKNKNLIFPAVHLHSGCDLLQQVTNRQNHVILHDVRVWGAQSPSRCRRRETARRSSFVYEGESCS